MLFGGRHAGRASGLHVKPCFSNLNASFRNNLLRNLAITNVKITYYLLISMDLLHDYIDMPFNLQHDADAHV